MAKRARCALTWSAACYILCQLAFTGALCDPEYEGRLETLRARLAEASHRPLLLLVGSSRTLMGFGPEILPSLRTPSGQEVLTFNFAHAAAGPVMNLMEVHRLLRDGIHPDWLVLEIMPPFLAGEGNDLLTCDVSARDLPLLQHYVNPWMLYGQYALTRLLTEHRPQREFLRRHGLGWVLGALGRPGLGLRPLGGVSLDKQVDNAKRQALTGLMRSQYLETLQNYALSPDGDRATRALLDLCGREHIQLVLLLMPESSAFRSWYSQRALTTLSQYLDRICGEYHVPLIDARTWVADDDFIDGHHVLQSGALAFTSRLGREVLQPLVEGKLSGSRRAAAGLALR
jgi:hypothetical protein